MDGGSDATDEASSLESSSSESGVDLVEVAHFLLNQNMAIAQLLQNHPDLLGEDDDAGNMQRQPV